jgi:FixJ family two-component response regulator
MSKRSLISVVDDDQSIRESLPDLLCEMGYEARTFASAQEFLASGIIGQTECLILDITMPGMSGPELQQELKVRQHNVPIVFISAYGGSDAFRVVARGAVACLFKPFTDAQLDKALKTALLK